MLASVSFYLRDPKSEHTSVQMWVFFQDNRIKLSTGLVVPSSDWDKDSQRIKRNSSFDLRDEYNMYFNSITQKINRHILNQLNMGFGAPTPDEVKTFIRGGSDKTLTPSQYIAQYISSSAERTNLKTGSLISERTIKKYRTTERYFMEYSKGRLSWSDLNGNFCQNFNRFLQKKHLSVNTIEKHVSIMRTFIKAAFDDKVHNETGYQERKFTVPKEKAQHTYLTVDELHLIGAIDLSNNERLDRVRDIFILECWTGLRYSDIMNLRNHDLNGETIRVTTYKTKQVVHVPVTSEARKIIDKYPDGLPGGISNQKYNQYIKEVVQLAGVNRIFVRSITKGGQRYSYQYEAWEVISSHTARRSFATNMYLLGFPSIQIMAITGHATESQFMKYICISSEESAMNMVKQLKRMQKG